MAKRPILELAGIAIAEVCDMAMSGGQNRTGGAAGNHIDVTKEKAPAHVEQGPMA